IEYGDYDILEDIFIAPSKGSITRDIDPETVPYTYADVYYNDEFFLSNESSTGETFILRDFRGLNIKVFPYQYNPATKELRIYKTANIKVVKNNQIDAINELVRARTEKSLDKEFSEIYKRQFLNFSNFQTRYTPLAEGTPGTIVVLAKSEFIDNIADYVSWKREKGHEVILVKSDTVGGTNANNLKTWVQNYFHEINFTYLLIVGDAQHIPPLKISNEDSDNAYAYVLGNDSYADFFVGRFSGESSADILTQVQRTVHYERDLNETDTWIENAFGSASSEGAGWGHDGGESDVQHLDKIKNALTDYGYTVTHVNEAGGNNTQILNAFNSGQSLANYIGHGDVTLWVNTNFTNTNVNQLQNKNKLPFVISVACVNGAFRGTTCFAEAWLRAQKDGLPTGALVFLGSTINQSWEEPMTAQDEMNEVLIEMHQNNIKRTVGGVAYAGYFKMIEAGGEGISTANTWTVFGDPSASLRTKTPEEMTIAHNNVMILGTTEFQVACDTDGALAALSTEENGETILLGYAYVADGNAQIELFEPITTPVIVKLTLTAFNKITYQENIQVIVPDGPF
ncbi:MAG: hypothetical protein GX879_03910, partial [Bacteroidales bacterium]|nr:hypothetical protein [Bacteroidales bacterium]